MVYQNTLAFWITPTEQNLALRFTATRSRFSIDGRTMRSFGVLRFPVLCFTGLSRSLGLKHVCEIPLYELHGMAFMVF